MIRQFIFALATICHLQYELSGYGAGKFGDLMVPSNAVRTPPQLLSENRIISTDICNEKYRME